ncbi:MAG: FAD-dependent thymidylate synthase [Terrisporobacter sp.]|uniref:FAD-dependent thymidylate synthase n=1 Tax=Terrisporobacter sp. TaxID=1965305 RepID=UPI002A90F4BC|nr:FAD-dependent thymidylate synthase [Terrisporobacter sp.]MDY6152795.1 FAD-dependent thymidylate synthase [Terrisporobacter sp.]
MKIINPSVMLEDEIDGQAILKKLERIGRTCYKSEGNIKEDSAEKFVKNIMNRNHMSVIEHESISVRIICDRGVTHEIVRHRIASYSQESTRYCNYSNDKFGNELTFIKPCFFDEGSEGYEIWKKSMQNIENEYMKLIEVDATPQEARSILPNSIKTELVMTMNLREWRHFFLLRCDKAAHPQMRQVANLILNLFKANIPIIFDDIEPYGTKVWEIVNKSYYFHEYAEQQGLANSAKEMKERIYDGNTNIDDLIKYVFYGQNQEIADSCVLTKPCSDLTDDDFDKAMTVFLNAVCEFK